MNSLPKYVVSSTLEHPHWSNSTVLKGDVVTEVSKLKQELDGDIVVYASYQLGRTLIEHDLVDELRLIVFPVVLGAGERLFGETSDKKPMRLVDTRTVGDGLAFLTYELVRFDLTFLRVDVTQVLHHLERAALGAGDVHVHPHVVLTGHHLGGASRALRDPGVVQCRDDVGLVERPGLVDRRLPELERPVRTGARTPRREHRAPGEEPVVPVEQLDAERVVDRPVVVQTAVETPSTCSAGTRFAELSSK